MGGTIPLDDKHIATLGRKYQKEPGQIMLKWALQRGTSVISKSVNPDRIISNFQLFDWELSAADMQSFDTINCGWRHLLWGETSHHPNYPFRETSARLRPREEHCPCTGPGRQEDVNGASCSVFPRSAKFTRAETLRN